jgi:hypothetical protein
VKLIERIERDSLHIEELLYLLAVKEKEAQKRVSKVWRLVPHKIKEMLR